jgi:hypothetical protein
MDRSPEKRVKRIPTGKRGRQNAFTDSLPIKEEGADRWCLWRPDHADFDSRSIFESALVEQ